MELERSITLVTNKIRFLSPNPNIGCLQNVKANGSAVTTKKYGTDRHKKELKKLDKDKLIDLVADLYKKNKSVKEFFDFYVNPNERELFNKYRNKVFEAFYPKRGDNYKIKEGKQAISDFKKTWGSN